VSGQEPPQPDFADADEPTQQVSQWARLRRAVDLDLDNPADSRFGDYQLLEKIGTGGMGVVYRARQVSLDREVALKLLSFDPFEAESLISRFRTEARHAGRLQHPNIVPVYEIGSFENLYYFSMSLVRGPTLRQWLKAHPSPSAVTVARLMRTIAEAVQYAHQVGILHLDLKPGNVLIDERGEPQVSDFGLARRVGEAADGARETVIAGTPAFMAPEQSLADPKALSVATDVWGLGGILYALLTGRPPLDDVPLSSASRWEVLAPRARVPTVAADLDAICRHCLQRDPAARYASARELADDLQRFLDGRPVSVRRQGAPERLLGWARREPRAAALAAGLSLAVLGGLVGTTLLWRQSDASRALAQATLWDARRAEALAAAERGDPLAGLPALVANVGEAEASDSADDADIDRRRIGRLLSAAPRQIAGWRFADEGRSLAFAEDGGLLLVGLRGGELVALEVDGGHERWRIHPPFPPTPWGSSFVGRALPAADGRHAVLLPSGSSGVARPDTVQMHRVDLRSGALTEPPAEFGPVFSTTYSDDGQRALLRDAEGGFQLWSMAPWRPLGARFQRAGLRNCLLPAQGTRMACARPGFASIELLDALSGRHEQDITFSDGAELAGWSVDAAGRWLALGSARGELVLLDLLTGERHAIADAGEDALGDLSFSGALLAVSSGGGSVRLLDLAQRRWLSRPLLTGANRVNSALYDPQSHWLLANDGRVVLWQLEHVDGRLVQPREASVLRHPGAVVGYHAATMHAASGLVASHGSEGELKLFRLPRSVPRAPYGSTLLGHPGPRAPATAVEVDGSRLRMVAADATVETIDLPARPYLLQGSADGRRWLMAAGSQLLILDRSVGGGSQLHALPLPASIQYLLLAENGERAVLGWLRAEGRLQVAWRGIELDDRRWLADSISEGLPGGVRLAADGKRLLLWQGGEVQVRAVDGSNVAARFEIADAHLQITDVIFAGVDGRELLLSTGDRSSILPATLEHWRLADGAAAQRLARIETPTAHARMFDLGGAWLGHGPRAALYHDGRRDELADLGAAWTEAAAMSPDRRWAALGQDEDVLLVDLQRRQRLGARYHLRLPSRDALAQLAFSADGAGLRVRSHFGQLFELPIGPDPRPWSALQSEADDLVPSRDRPRQAINALARRARDPGPPLPLPTLDAPSLGRDPAATAAQIDLRPYANVPERRWFQGAWRGLGITDSAAWPHGLLRLRGVDFELGPAVQLAPDGVALGAASFVERSGAIALPKAAWQELYLLLGNQQEPAADGLQLAWLDADGNTLAEQPLQVPTFYDGAIHSAGREHQPRGEVALVLRSAESPLRGGGSPQLLAYLLRLTPPPTARPIAAVELRAPAATPLLLGMSVR
jgi:hypothetical protein